MKSAPERHLPVAVILSICMFLIGLSSAAITPYRAIVAVDNLGMANSLYALVMTLGSIGTAIASLVLGNFADKVPDRRYLVIGSALMGALAYGLIYLLPTQLTYIIAIVVVLPFGGALFSQTFSFSRVYYNLHQPERAEFMVSSLRTLFSVAWVVVPPVAGWVASRYSVYDVFAAAAVAHLGFTLIFGLLLRDPTAKISVAKTQDDTDTQDDAEKSSYLPLSRVVGMVGVLLISVTIFLEATVIPLALINDFGGTLATVGLNASISAGLEIPFILVWGWASNRLSKETILSINGFIFALYLLLVFNASSALEVLWLQGLNAVATGALLSINISYLQETVRGRVGLSTSLIDVVKVLSSLIASVLFALLAGEESYIALFAAASILSLVGALVIGISRQPRLASFKWRI